MSTPSLEVSLECKPELVASFTAYVVEISNPAATWTVLRRYRQFRSLHNELEHLLKSATPPGSKLPPFPPKKWFGNRKPDFVATRRGALETYLRAVVSRPDTSQSHFLRSFLDPQEKPAAMSLKSPKKEGQLRKREASMFLDKWKNCWAVVANSRVYIYSSSRDLEPEETANLREIMARVSPEHGIETFEICLLSGAPTSGVVSQSQIVASDASKEQNPKIVKTIVMRAGSLEEAEEWVRVLRHELEASHAPSIISPEGEESLEMKQDTSSKPAVEEVTERRSSRLSFGRPRSQSVEGSNPLMRKLKGKSLRPDSIIKDQQTHKKRTQVVQEILSSEESYVNSLSVLIRLFLIPLRESALTNPILSPAKIKTIFSEVEVIYNVNRLLLTDLKSRMESWSPTQVLGDVFLQMIEFLKTYQSYINNFSAALEALTKELQENRSFSGFLEKIYLSPECSGLSLQSFLIMPIQRIPRYVMLLDDLVKKTPETHRDYQQLDQTLERMRTVATKLNDAKRDAESLTQVLSIQMRLVGKFENLVVPSRRFIKEVEAIEEGVIKGKPARRLILFNDVLLVTKMKKNNKEQHYRYKISLNIITTVESLSLTVEGKPMPQLQLGIDNGQKWVWTFPDPADRDLFMEAISGTVANYRKQQQSFYGPSESTISDK